MLLLWRSYQVRQIIAAISVPRNVICVNIYVIWDKYTTLFSEYLREDGKKGLQLADYEAGAEIDPDNEIPDGVPVISPLVEGEFYQGDADLTDEQKEAVGSRIDERELTEIELRQAWVGQRGAERYKWDKSSDGKVYVPYTFQNYNSYTAKERANIAGAFEQYEQKTCLRYQD